MLRLRVITLIMLSALFLSCVALAQSTPSIPPFADAATATGIRASASSHRAFGEKMQSQAKEYRELEANARRYAGTSQRTEDRVDWEKSANEHAANAQNLELRAAEELAKAAEEEAQANAIDAMLAKKNAPPPAPAPPQTTDNSPAPAAGSTQEADACTLPMGSLLGMWQYGEGSSGEGASFAIVQANPESAESTALELHGGKRKWTGTFNRDPNLPRDKPRIVFTYKPQPKEMNSEIPDWARAKLDGQLEWQMEIHVECEDGAVMPFIKFFPGEVRWQEDGSETVEIIGRGKERRKDMVPDDSVLTESEAESAIGIQVGEGQDPFIHPAEALIKGQRFHVVVRLPADLAKEVGNTLTVEIEGQGRHNGDTVELTAAPSRKEGQPVNYNHTAAITIADNSDELPRKPQIMSLNWIFQNTGDRINLVADNEEVIRFKFRDLTFDVPIYNTWVQRGNVRFAQGADRLRIVFQSVIDGPYTQTQKDNARKRMRMLDNYAALIGSDKLTDVHRYRLGEVYLGDGGNSAGLVQMSDAQIGEAWEDPRGYHGHEEENEPEVLNPLLQAYLEGLSGKDLSSQSHKAMDGIVWTSETESQKVDYAIRHTTRRLRNELLTETYKNMTFGMYQGIVSATGTEDIYLLATGKDAFGRRVPTWQRIQVAIGLGSGIVLKLAGPTAWQRFTDRLAGNRVALPKKVKVTYRTVGTGQAAALDKLERPHTPKSLSAAQAEQTFLSSVEEPAGAGGGPQCGTRARTAGAGNVLTREQAMRELQAGLQEIFADDPAFHQDAEYMQRSYPRSLTIKEDFSSSFQKQSMHLPTCQAKTVEWIIWKRTGFQIGEAEAHHIIDQLVNEELKVNPSRLQFGRGYGVVHGYENWMIRKFGRMFGMKVSEVPGAMNRLTKLRAIKAWLDRGASVKAVLKLKDGGIHALHAVSIEGMAVNSKGFVTRVRFFDPNVAAILELPAHEFAGMLLEQDLGYGAITVFQ